MNYDVGQVRTGQCREMKWHPIKRPSVVKELCHSFLLVNRPCVKVEVAIEVAILGSQSLVHGTVSVDVKQH